MIRVKLHIVLSIMVAILMVISYFLFHSWTKEKQNYERMYANSKALGSELTELKAKNGQLISQNQVLRLRADELKGLLPSIFLEIQNLRIKPSRTESYGETAFEATTKTVVQLRDSIIYDTIKLKTFEYFDGYFYIKGIAQGKEQKLELAYHDTLIQAVYWGDRPKPWLWLFSKRPLMQRVSIKNPNAKILYSQLIKIER